MSQGKWMCELGLLTWSPALTHKYIKDFSSVYTVNGGHFKRNYRFEIINNIDEQSNSSLYRVIEKCCNNLKYHSSERRRVYLCQENVRRHLELSLAQHTVRINTRNSVKKTTQWRLLNGKHNWQSCTVRNYINKRIKPHHTQKWNCK